MCFCSTVIPDVFFQLPVCGVFSCRLCNARSVHFISCSFTDSVDPPLSCSASGSSLWGGARGQDETSQKVKGYLSFFYMCHEGHKKLDKVKLPQTYFTMQVSENYISQCKWNWTLQSFLDERTMAFLSRLFSGCFFELRIQIHFNVFSYFKLCIIFCRWNNTFVRWNWEEDMYISTITFSRSRYDIAAHYLSIVHFKCIKDVLTTT